MKLETLFALYLYQNKILNLPGIGSFTAETTIGVPEDNEKHPTTVQGISFINKQVTEPDSAFIDFIRQHTGKMRPLAISDLESYLMLSKQFLNIGKPFYIEGIGTLQKVNDGSLKFTPGEYSSTRLPVPAEEKNVAEPATNNMYRNEEKREYQRGGGGNNSSKKAFILLAAIVTILLIGWGGYYLFKKNAVPEHLADTSIDTSQLNALSTDTGDYSDMRADTMELFKDTLKTAELPVATGTYKFILETTSSKARALKRFSDLLSYRAPVKMETADSVRFVIFTYIKATPKDTIRLKDSLNAWYYGTKEMKVSIAQ